MMVGNLTSEIIKEYILELERKYPVDQWQVNGVDVWPYIRIKLYILLLNQGVGKLKLNNSFSSKNKKKPAIRKFIKIFGSIAKAIIVLFQFYKKLEPKKIIFFGSHFHRTRQNGVYFNRFFDPMVDAHQLQDEIYMIEFEKLFNKNFNQKAILPLHKYLDQYKLLKKLNRLFSQSGKENFELQDYRAFYEELSNDFSAAKVLNISVEALSRWSRKISRTKGFFSKFFNKTNPEKIIFLSYYGYDDLAAAILAAHELGIKTIDFQHGPQTNVHMAYSHWTKVPEDSFNIMPKEYWCWDEATKQNIDEWAKDLPEIESKVAGHPYLGYWAGKIAKNEVETQYILYSLQVIPIQEHFPENLITVIKNTKWQWVFRLHPRSSFGQDEIKVLLSGYGLTQKDYMIENSAQKPLPQTILGALVHVTNFSGCVIESSMMAVPSIIIDKRGKEIFDNYLDGSSVFFLNKENQEFEENFVRLIGQLENTKESVKRQKIVNPLTF